VDGKIALNRERSIQYKGTPKDDAFTLDIPAGASRNDNGDAKMLVGAMK
jgi:hypothetical protein